MSIQYLQWSQEYSKQFPELNSIYKIGTISNPGPHAPHPWLTNFRLILIKD